MLELWLGLRPGHLWLWLRFRLRIIHRYGFRVRLIFRRSGGLRLILRRRHGLWFGVWFWWLRFRIIFRHGLRFLRFRLSLELRLWGRRFVFRSLGLFWLFYFLFSIHDDRFWPHLQKPIIPITTADTVLLFCTISCPIPIISIALGAESKKHDYQDSQGEACAGHVESMFAN